MPIINQRKRWRPNHFRKDNTQETENQGGRFITRQPPKGKMLTESPEYPTLENVCQGAHRLHFRVPPPPFDRYGTHPPPLLGGLRDPPVPPFGGNGGTVSSSTWARNKVKRNNRAEEETIPFKRGEGPLSVKIVVKILFLKDSNFLGKQN